MTYFGFLALFLGIPIIILLIVTWVDRRRQLRLPSYLSAFPLWTVLLLHILIALIYTTPWDNYLVATRVWWYDPELVTGITFGWVPIEEYTFFILQPLLTGLWLVTHANRQPRKPRPFKENGRHRFIVTGVTTMLWIGILILGFSGWEPGTYLALELGWALPPIMLQLAFGADILWHHRRMVAMVVLTPTLYLAVADALAIGSGTWTINPDKSLQWLIAGILPVEELLFFFLTNTLIVFGMTLALATQSQTRFRGLKRLFNGRYLRVGQSLSQSKS